MEKPFFQVCRWRTNSCTSPGSRDFEAPFPACVQSYLTGLFGDVLQAEGEHFPCGSDDELADVVSYHQRAQTAKARLFELFQAHV